MRLIWSTSVLIWLFQLKINDYMDKFIIYYFFYLTLIFSYFILLYHSIKRFYYYYYVCFKWTIESREKLVIDFIHHSLIFYSDNMHTKHNHNENSDMTLLQNCIALQILHHIFPDTMYYWPTNITFNIQNYHFLKVRVVTMATGGLIQNKSMWIGLIE